MTEFPHLTLRIVRRCIRVGDFVETVHVELADERLPICVLEIGGQDNAREFRGTCDAECGTVGDPVDHVLDLFILEDATKQKRVSTGLKGRVYATYVYSLQTKDGCCLLPGPPPAPGRPSRAGCIGG